MTERRKKYAIWTWLNGNGAPVYIGWGAYENTHPAKSLWAARYKQESELNTWLRGLSSEPRRANTSTTIPMYKKEARSIAEESRRRARRNGYVLLSSRPDGTKAGGGKGRAVMDAEGNIYRSVRAAASDYCVNPCTVTRWASSPNSGWCYL